MGFKKTFSRRFKLIARDFIFPALSTAGTSVVSWLASTWIPGLGLPGPLETAVATAVLTVGFKAFSETDYGDKSTGDTQQDHP